MSELSSLLSQYGVTNELSPTNLVAMRTAFVELLESIKKTSVGTMELRKQVSEELKSNMQLKEQAKKLAEQVNELLFDQLLEKPELAVPLLEEWSNIRSDIADEKEYIISKIARQRKPKQANVSTDDETKRKLAGKLRDGLVGMFNAMSAIPGVDLPNTKDFPIKKTKDNEVIPDLPRIPSPGRAPGAGRNAKHNRLQFKWNGEKVPAEMFPSEVCHDLISSESYRVTWKQVRDALKNMGIDELATDHTERNPWKIKLETGTLEGWLPSDSNGNGNGTHTKEAKKREEPAAKQEKKEQKK